MTRLWRAWRQWACEHLGWHRWRDPDGWDGCSLRATCTDCGHRGMVDSQGNLF